MTRKALNAFNPDSLKPGEGRIFEVRNPKTGFGEHHYFYRDDDGELFTVVCKHGMNEAVRLQNEWKKKKQEAKGEEEKVALEEGVLYHLETGIAHIAVCAPAKWNAEKVAKEVNLQSRPGTMANEWVLAEETADVKNGLPCRDDPNRKHWLLVC